MKKLAMFAAGVLFGTAGIKLLSSKDAKKAYTHTTAAVLRAKDSVMKTVTTARENVEDIYSDAKAINEQRADDEQSDAQVLSLPSALFNEGARRAVAGPQGLSRAAPALRMPPTMAKPQTGSSVP